MRDSRVIILISFIFIAAGCSINDHKINGCIVHSDIGAFAGVAWAECPARSDVVYIPGQAAGWITAAAPIIGGVANGAGTVGAAAIVAPAVSNISSDVKISAPSQ